jgi:hypothetical protein
MTQDNEIKRELPNHIPGIEELRKRGNDNEIKLNVYSEETLRIVSLAERLVDSFFEKNKDLIEESLNPYSDLIHDIKMSSIKRDELDSSIKDIFKMSLNKFIDQEIRCLKKDSYTNTILGDLSDPNNLKKLIKELFNEFLRTLEISNFYKLNPFLTKKLLNKLYMVNPENIPYLLKKYSDSPVQPNQIIVFVSSHRNPEESVKTMIRRHDELVRYVTGKTEREQAYINKSVLNRFARLVNPKQELDNFLERIKEVINFYNDIPESVVEKIVLNWPNEFEGKLSRYRQNIKLIDEVAFELPVQIKIAISLKANSDQEVKELLNEYIRISNELIEIYPDYRSFIRTNCFNKSKESMVELILRLDKEVLRVLKNLPSGFENIRNPKGTIIKVADRHGIENIQKSLENMSKYFKLLTDFFYENSPIFKKVIDEYGINILQIERISPTKSFEENKSDFINKLSLFESLFQRLERKYGVYKKHSQNTGYMIFLINSIYRSNPEEYLKLEGYEI